MPELIENPSRVEAAGTKPKLIDEFVGRVNTGEERLSVARMNSPQGWVEPGQRPDFDEWTLVLDGTLTVEHEAGVGRRPRRAGDPRPGRRMGALLDALPRRRRVRRRLPAGLLAGHGAPRRRRVMSPDGLQASIEKMRAAGVGDAAIDTFAHYYEQLREGASGMLPESDIEPVEDLPTLDELPEGDPAIVDTAVVLKLNGGLGTSMGMTKAKSLIEAKEGQTFLDIVVGQVLALRERFGARVPLVLMNSFATRDDSLEALRRHPEIESDVPLDFLQNKVPKIAAETCSRSRGRPTRRSSGRRPATATSTPRSSRRACSTRSSSTATATPSSRTPTTSAPSSTRGSSPGSRARSCPSRWRSPGAPRPIARAGTSRG